MANLRLGTPLRNALCMTVRDLIDAAGGPGTIKFYTAPQPENVGVALEEQELLATLTLSYPCAPDPMGGLLQFFPIEEESDAPKTGKAAWARVYDGDGKAVMDCDVTGPGGGGLIEINTVDIVEGGPVRAKSFAINFPAG